jgi:arginyl-tRNA synthetase
VHREYYINDAGAQVDVLARSMHLRYREALGEAVGAIPEGFYPGEYLAETGRALAARDGDRWQNKPEAEWLAPLREFAITEMLALIRADLAAFGVHFDTFTSERSLVESGAVDAGLAALEQRGLIYTGVLEPPKGKLPEDWEPRPQTLFRATQFGDEVDRPLKKSDGSWTYFAADIAYHHDKVRRGFNNLIDVWGADHGGYVKRMQAAVKALSEGAAALDVKLTQLVHLFDKGEPVKMSKRAGTFVTLREVVDEVGKDVFRFIMLTRKNDQTLAFDFAKVVEKSNDNPVFYVQYAHARTNSVMRNAAERFPEMQLSDAALAAAPLSRLTDSVELATIRLLASWPRIVEGAADTHEPHRIAFFLQEVAAQFHQLWNKGNDEATLRFLIADDSEVTLARLALVRGVAVVIASGLAVFGVEPVGEM